MSTVHGILRTLSLESDHSIPPSAYRSVKAYTNFNAIWDAFNFETLAANRPTPRAHSHEGDVSVGCCPILVSVA
uniref:Uncharacterized protein n=1 Tax=Rhinolophus ferrumequinum TaxID=59479 RepID=A0A671FRY6_RHIFE